VPEELRDLAEDGTISLRVAGVMPAGHATEAHHRLAAGGIRGRIFLWKPASGRRQISSDGRGKTQRLGDAHVVTGEAFALPLPEELT
jgi:hypothetical protein